MLEQPAKDYLLAIAKAYAGARGLALTTVARRFHGMDSFFEDFTAGRCTITLKKYDSMIEQFRSQWPKAAEWPKQSPQIDNKKPVKIVA